LSKDVKSPDLNEKTKQKTC